MVVDSVGGSYISYTKIVSQAINSTILIEKEIAIGFFELFL